MLLKKNILILCFVIFNFLQLNAQQLNKEQILKDLKVLGDSLPAKHINLFAKISKKDFENRINSIKSKADTLTYPGYIIELYKLMAEIGEEHTGIGPDLTTIFPLRFDYFDEGIVITAADTTYREFLGTQLLKINTTSIDQVIKLFSEILKKDNLSFQKIWTTQYLNKSLILKGLNIIDDEKEAVFTVLTARGDTIVRKVSSIAIDKNPVMLKCEPLEKIMVYSSNKNYWFRYDSLNRIMYLNYMRCKDDEKISFEELNKKLFSAISETNPVKLVIDLRFNGGGNSAILQPFIDSIKTHPLNKKGSFYVIFGRKTFSSALMNSVELVRETNCISVGEMTGADINHYGEVRSFVLPESKMIVAYSTRFWNTWPGKNGGLIPDFPVAHSLKVFRSNHDEALDFIINDKRK